MHAPQHHRQDAARPKRRHDTTWGGTLRTRRAILALLFAGLPLAPAFAVPTAKEVEKKAEQLATNEIQNGPAAGMSILVARKGKVLLAKGYGYADIEKKIPATEHTIYRLGSLSKQFTATATMQLVDKGLVRLDDSIRTYLPDYPAVGQAVTVRHLLNHTSGLMAYTAMSEYWKHINDDLPRSAVLGWFANRELAYTPGDRYVYTNSGYFLLGLIIEHATGETYPDYLKRNIFDSCNLKNTFYDHGDGSVPGEAMGYAREGDKLVPARKLNTELVFSAGAVASNVLDMYAFHHALRSGALVTPESYALMTTPARLNNNEEITEYGMGFHVNEWGGHTAFRHGGLVFGFKTSYYYYPKEDLTVIVMMNTENSEYRPIQTGLARLFIPDLGPGADYE